MMTTMPDKSLDAIAAELCAARDRLEQKAGRDPGVLGVARLLGRVGNRLARPPRVAILGEFNSGKSTLANALIGSELLPTSIHANTRIPILIRYAQFPVLSVEMRDGTRNAVSLASLPGLDTRRARLLMLGLPVARLKNFEIIDTPGLASGQSRLDGLTIEACARSHFAVWCTSAQQAWKATERAQWVSLPKRLRTNSILAVSHIDGLRGDERNVERLRQRIASEAAPLFRGYALVSGADAADSARDRAGAQWHDSGGAEIEALVSDSVSLEMASRAEAAERVLERAARKLIPAKPQPALVA